MLAKHYGLRWEHETWNKPPEEKKNISGHWGTVRFIVQAQVKLNCGIGGYNEAYLKFLSRLKEPHKDTQHLNASDTFTLCFSKQLLKSTQIVQTDF